MDLEPPLPPVVTFDDLPLELLTRIAELVNSTDLASLRLVSKSLLAAVQEAAVSVRPSNKVQTDQLSRLPILFNKATALNLLGCSALNTNALRYLQDLARLRTLHIDTG